MGVIRMRRANIVGFDIVVPDNVADWDAVAGPGSNWERARLQSMLGTLQPGDVVYDIGAEMGWMSVILGLRVGGENMVLVEPSQEFWPNIRMGWEENGLFVPLACAQAFAGAGETGSIWARSWPQHAWGPECGAMAYRHPNHHSESIQTVSIDQLSGYTGQPPKGITIDVEGAELGVLQGAERTLRNDRPNVWVSVHDDLMRKDFGTNPAQLIEFMRDLDYRMIDLGYDHEHHMYFRPVEWA
jgi:FkbM family methyltransferase